MKPLLALIAVTLLGLAATACGSAGKGAGSTSRGSSASGAIAGAASTASGGTAASGSSSFKGDEDDDDSSSNYLDSTKYDNDADFDDDRARQLGYQDSDDGEVMTYGHTANAADKRALTAIVKRYYAAAAVADGVTGCSLLAPTLRKAVPEDYGQAPGPVYTRGKTCHAVITLLFKHEHRQLAVAKVEVTGVRVKGNEALVILGSRTQPASYVFLERRRGGPWGMIGLLAVTLP